MDDTNTASDTNSSQPAEKMNYLIIGVMLVAIIIGGVYLMKLNTNNTPGSEPQESEEQKEAAGGTEETVTPTAATDINESETQIRTIEIEAGSFYYKPNEITMKKGETVNIVMKSVDMMHDFVIDELGVRIPVTKSGETASVEYTADTTGSFEFYCSVGQHRANGMVGKLIVEE